MLLQRYNTSKYYLGSLGTTQVLSCPDCINDIRITIFYILSVIIDRNGLALLLAFMDGKSQGGSHPSPSGSVTLLEVLLVGLPAALPGPVGLAVSRARQEAWLGAQLL